ncbi:MAG: hypothetical protein ACKO38_21310, partial [Planctomycetota bacterium]
MSHMSTPIQRHIATAIRKKKTRSWLSTSLLFANICVAGILAVGLAMSNGWIEYRVTALGLFCGLLLISFLVWGITTIVCWLWPVQRRRFVRDLEEQETRLEERLSTVVHLEEQLARPSIQPTLASPPEKRAEYEQQQRQEEVTRWFRQRIERQAAAILTAHSARRQALPWSIWRRAAAFMVLSGLTVWFFAEWQPWENLKRGNAWRFDSSFPVTPTSNSES